jgi:hypothetical protein
MKTQQRISDKSMIAKRLWLMALAQCRSSFLF